MGKIFWSKIDGGAGTQENRPGWEGRSGMEGGSSLRAKGGRNRGKLSNSA